MGFSNYLGVKQPWESFKEYEHRLREFRRVQEEEELRRMHRSMGIPPSMSGMNGIGGRIERYEEFCARADRERVEVELQRTKQNTRGSCNKEHTKTYHSSNCWRRKSRFINKIIKRQDK